MNQAQKIQGIRYRLLAARRLVRALELREARALRQPRFGTTSDRVLQVLQHGPATILELRKKVCGSVSNTLTRLLDAKQVRHRPQARGIWELACVVLLLLVVGCKAPKARGDARPTLPPMPQARGDARPTAMQAEAVIIVPPPVRTVTLYWNKNDPDPETVTEVWQSTNLIQWQAITNTHAEYFTLPADQPAAYFKVRNRRGSELSEWATRE